MQEDIHPELHETEIECASGASFKVLSTQEELHTDVSSNNHPFFTGERKLMDTTGRVEKFRDKYDLSGLKGEAGQRREAKSKEERRKELQEEQQAEEELPEEEQELLEEEEEE